MPLLLAFFGAGGAWIENRAEKAVLDEEFLAKLSERVRPSCIVNTRNSISAERGTPDYIDRIKVTPSPGVFGYDIEISCKQHLPYAPIVTALNVSLYPQEINRGQGHDWKITMTPQLTIEPFTQGRPMDTNKVYEFFVEVLHPSVGRQHRGGRE